MTSHIALIATILNTITGYTITQYPDDAAATSYRLIPYAVTKVGLMLHEQYYLVIKATSLDYLETYIAALLACDSGHPSGYHYTTATYPEWLDVNIIRKDWDETEYLGLLAIQGRWSI